MKWFLLPLLVWNAAVHAEELLPELAPFAQKREAASAALEEARRVAMAATRPPYIAALDAADKAATAAGKVQFLAAIARERERVEKGGMAATFPSDLPKNLEPYRRTYLKTRERTEADFDLKQKTSDAAYLRNLASLQFKAAANPSLAAQILKEKQKVVAGAHGPITDVSVGLENTRWKSVGGDQIYHFSGGKLNGIWGYETEARDKVRIKWNPNSSVTLTLGRDGKTFLEGNKVTHELMTREQK